MLNPKSPIPLYHQLADILTQRIRSGEYAAGTRIPSEHQLAADYGIGRPTARQATELLVGRRLLVRRRGAGTFVLNAGEEVDLFSLAGTSEAFRRKGIASSPQILGAVRQVTVSEESEGPFAGRSAYTFSRLWKADGEPVLIETLQLDPVLFKDLERVFRPEMSMARLAREHYFLVPGSGTQHFRIAYVTGAHARYLNVSANTPVLAVQRALHFPVGENGVYAELYCRTDRFVFTQTIGDLTHE